MGELRNVYVGGHVKVFGVPFLHLRTFMPPIGMLMVVLIPLSIESNFGDKFATAIHYLGAVLLLGSYGCFELYTLACAEFVHIQSKERIIRWFFCVSCLLCGLGFWIFGQSQTFTHRCCGDSWRIPTQEDAAIAKANGHLGTSIEDMVAAENHKNMLYDSASGAILTLKYLTYWCEVGAGFSMIGSLITIWYFAPERLLEAGEELPGTDYGSSEVGDPGVV